MIKVNGSRRIDINWNVYYPKKRDINWNVYKPLGMKMNFVEIVGARIIF